MKFDVRMMLGAATAFAAATTLAIAAQQAPPAKPPSGAPAATGASGVTGAVAKPAAASTGTTGTTGTTGAAKAPAGTTGATGSTGAPKNNPAMSKPAVLQNSEKQAWVERMIDVPKLGSVMAYVPKHPTSTHVVLFFSGDGEWTLGVVDMARRMADRAVVIGLSYPKLRRAAPADTCWSPVADIEEIAHAAEKAVGLAEYHPPILLGYSSGATLVYAAFVMAPPTAFAGGMSLGFCPDLPANHPVCPVGEWKPTFEVKKGGAILPKVAAVPHDWHVLIGVEDVVCVPAEMHLFLDDMKGAHMYDVPHSGHGFGNEKRWGPIFDDSFAKLLAADVKTGLAPIQRR